MRVMHGSSMHAAKGAGRRHADSARRLAAAVNASLGSLLSAEACGGIMRLVHTFGRRMPKSEDVTLLRFTR
jgi:hypothetical protein